MTKTAMIVEDEIFVALDLERILIDAGYHVVAIAADRETALIAAAGCDFAFVDVNLRDGPTGPSPPIPARSAMPIASAISASRSTMPRSSPPPNWRPRVRRYAAVAN
jgi:ActR/RegA family two-component response regulator